MRWVICHDAPFARVDDARLARPSQLISVSGALSTGFFQETYDRFGFAVF